MKEPCSPLETYPDPCANGGCRANGTSASLPQVLSWKALSNADDLQVRQKQTVLRALRLVRTHVPARWHARAGPGL